ncbi:C40 family peptidase [Larkinella terrae]|uniref:CHAP domain-containing protein n=1 Tax=Larkinella terrae TaxID=2025311 RepID=A0A7K0EQ65_9BACT|nr:C40 family peptidase [Larkinella terrae]MRS63939.1 CHAP domain-containing protein [Larkinella terrae]
MVVTPFRFFWPTVILAFTLSSCSFFKTSHYVPPAQRKSTVASRRPSTANRAPVAKPLKTVDTRTYQQGYVPEVVKIARTYTGTPYRTGGQTSDGMDCSGLIFAAFNTVGLQMPRISWQQSEVGYEVEVPQIQAGDLVFFVPENGKAGYVSHTGIVTEVHGENNIMFIHASSSRGVREDNLYSNYFKGRFVKAVRPF